VVESINDALWPRDTLVLIEAMDTAARPHSQIGSPAKSRDKASRVLVVDDDERLRETLRRGLTLHGFEVGVASDAGAALGYVQARWPDVIVLDIMMPGMDGVSLCRVVRENSSVPILMLTARDAVDDRVAGLEAGADDYIAKPFELKELVARIDAVLRRLRLDAPRQELLSYADITLNWKSWSAFRSRRRISLTATEFRLLELFVRQPERLLTRDDIMMELGEQSPVESNVVDVHVANLRRKLEEEGRPRLIQTIRGAGYMLKEE
jgi:DNA-binding response OmpR family regulator